MSIVQVALPVPMRKLFDYLSPSLLPGTRVLVEFGRRELVGIVIASRGDASVEHDKLKSVKSVLDDKPVFDAPMLALGQWLAGYLHHPLGDLLSSMLPAGLRRAQPLPDMTIEMLELTPKGERQLEQKMRAKQQQALMSLLTQGAIPLEQAREQFSLAVIKACCDSAFVVRKSVLREPSLDWQAHISLGNIPVPTSEQALAIATVTARLGRFITYLLEGVTGSGKTEVYLQTIQPVLLKGQQVLVLVPEIGLTPQTVKRFEQRFGLPIGLLHSGLNDRQRLTVWQQARSGEIGLVIGTRSAVFTPFKSLGLIIVDEEHDESYKQQDGPRYHARDVAVVRAQRDEIPLILGSATPSLESLNNALHHKYQLLQLHQRTGHAKMAQQNIMDVRSHSLSYGLADPMVQKMQTHLRAGGQVLVFVNRRGYAPSLVCHACGHVELCQRCDAPFTVHKSVGRLHCHRCENVRPVPRQCAQCASHDVLSQGVGTEQLEEGLQRLFPQYSSVRVDSDSVRGKDKLPQLIDAINRNQHQILIGTQILSKGHHFPRVTLVVIMDVDGALFSVDVRATEKLAQLITQLSGRAGRENRHGEMWLQSHHPDHPLLQDLIHNGYAHFARHALSERKAAHAPPFVQQTLFRAEATELNAAFEFLNETKALFTHNAAVQALGPFPAVQFKRAGRFRMLLTVQCYSRKTLHASIAECLPVIEASKRGKKVRWSIDVAPTDVS
ncbi:primosomal protein N' [Alteromonas oceanisediminis]|uniref:primosomal protein N' n=1 Tax=Alteromonas oceanisediminis TaxID=2836180 RepID=UPI001BDA3BD2|nr:primosomal protein N' [Alteromonas oceanisediminis]MBT0587711.1 primosomal protein N' [Alteromonas oceanisediminis]